MIFSNTPLKPILEILDRACYELDSARAQYLALASEKDHRRAVMIKQASGSSMAERTVNAQADPEWAVFHLKLSEAEVRYEHKKLQFSILEKEWLAQYAAHKEDSSLIKKQER